MWRDDVTPALTETCDIRTGSTREVPDWTAVRESAKAILE
jgi:hypothetical protein